MTLAETSVENVRFISQNARKTIARRTPSVDQKRPVFALLPDWRHRFTSQSEEPIAKEMPAAMKRAAEASQDEFRLDKPQSLPLAMSTEDEEWEDGESEEEEGDDIGSEDLQGGLASLDNETLLKIVLRQKLEEAGLSAEDENAYMDMIAKMISGEEGIDDVEKKLTNTLLERATEGNDTALSGWLSQQGVSLENDDETGSVATTELPNAANASNGVASSDTSPSDSAIGMQRAIDGTSKELAIHGSSPTASSKKRTATPLDSEEDVRNKRKKVTLNVPQLSELTSISQNDSVIQFEEHQSEFSNPSTSDDSSSITQNKATNASAVETNGTKIANGEPLTERNAKNGVDAAEQTEEPVPAPTLAKNTRKRKADVEKAVPKKQAKKAAQAPTEAVGKRTRSTRAATKAGK